MYTICNYYVVTDKTTREEMLQGNFFFSYIYIYQQLQPSLIPLIGSTTWINFLHNVLTRQDHASIQIVNLEIFFNNFSYSFLDIPLPLVV